MPKPKSTANTQAVPDFIKVEKGYFEVCILGSTPLLLNRMSEKAKRELLMPKGRKTAIDKMTTLKHDPVQEYRASAYRLPEPSKTLVGLMSSAFKGAMAGAALDMPGVKKTQIGRLTHVEGDYVSVYGIPKLHMAIVRSSDMNRTPDVRSRAILPKWACRLNVSFVQPLLTAQAVANLLAAGGITQGVGDGRIEKGKLNFGQFQLVNDDDPEYVEIVANGARAVQDTAFKYPQCYDDETTELLSWFESELDKRKKRGAPTGTTESKTEETGVSA